MDLASPGARQKSLACPLPRVAHGDLPSCHSIPPVMLPSAEVGEVDMKLAEAAWLALRIWAGRGSRARVRVLEGRAGRRVGG